MPFLINFFRVSEGENWELFMGDTLIVSRFILLNVINKILLFWCSPICFLWIQDGSSRFISIFQMSLRFGVYNTLGNLQKKLFLNHKFSYENIYRKVQKV